MNKTVIAIMLVVLAISAHSETIDPGFQNQQYAYGENMGWLNAEPGGHCRSGVHIAEDQVHGWMWSENVGWISLNCSNTESCANAAYETTISPVEGAPDLYQLAGHAWAENAGWISFSCANTQTCTDNLYGVHISADGIVTGAAWSENLGWIATDCATTDSCSNVNFGILTEALNITDRLFRDGFDGC